MRKKLFTLLLAIVVSIGTLFAESGTCGENLTWNLTDNVLTISGSGAMTDYDDNSSSPWDSYSSSIAQVIIGDEVTSIGDYAFYNCNRLTSVTIGNSVTSIGESAFENCSGLTSVTIGNSVESIVDYAFYNCNRLTSVTIGNSVTSIGESAFENCSGLTQVNISDLSAWCEIAFWGYDSNPLYYANHLYLNGEEITNLVIPNDITSIRDYAFIGCRGLTSVTIPNSVTSIGDYAFRYCSSLTSVTIPNSVTSIGDYAFYDIPNIVYNGTAEGSPWGARYINGYVDGCLVYSDATKTTLTACSSAAQGDIVIPNSVTNIGEYAFYDCDGLTSVTIGNSVTSIGDYAFSECSSLTSVTIPNSVTSIGNSAFSGCSGLTSVTIPNSVTSIGDYAFYDIPNIVYNGTAEGSPWGAKTINGYIDGYLVYSDATKTTLTACSTSVQGDIVIPNSVTTIGEKAFYRCSGLTSITIPNSVTSIEESAFSGCSGLTSVTIPNSVTSIGGGAFWCSSLTSINIPESIKSIEERTFSGCGLTDIVLPSSLETIGEWAFAQNTICDWLGLDCTPLIKTITCYSQLPPSVHSNDGEYDSFEESLTDDVIIYVPADYLNTYKAHDFWGMHDVRPLNEIATGIEDIFSNGGSQSSQPQKVLIDGKMYIALPNGHLYDATGKQVE